MDRRTLLAGLGVGLVGAAGCSESTAPDRTDGGLTQREVTARPSSTAGTPTPPTEAATAGPPAEVATQASVAAPVRLFSVEAPAEAQIGEPVRYRFTLENTAEEPQVVRPTVSSRSGSTGWSAHDRWDAVELAPGSRDRFDAPPFTKDYLGPVELRIDGFGKSVAIDFRERRLAFSAPYRDPLDREVSVESLGIRGSYEYTSDGTRYLAEAGPDLQWVFVTIKVVNRVTDSIRAPSGARFSLRDGDHRFRQAGFPDDSGYEPQRLPMGSGVTGRIAFKTPGTLSRDDFSVTWAASFEGGDVGVRWTPR